MSNGDQEKKADSVAFHFVAIVIGLAMMVLGLGLGVTMVLLPIGLPVGIVGLSILIWGLTPGLSQVMTRAPATSHALTRHHHQISDRACP